MYIPRSLLILIAMTYLLLLVSLDWMTQLSGAWYRPFIIAPMVIVLARCLFRERDKDDL